MQHTPPPFFKQGPSANARLLFFAVFALSLIVMDYRFGLLKWARWATATALYPVQQVMLLPRELTRGGWGYLSDQQRLLEENRALKKQSIQQTASAERVQQLQAEVEQLRHLIGLRETQRPGGVIAEVLYEARDPFVHRLVLDRGSAHGMTIGMPVLDDVGVVGQITRVFPMTSEVTLITDKEQAIPVQVARNGLRAIVFGSAGGRDTASLEIRFLPGNADVQENDVLLTSGLDGTYPPGLPVAKVVRVDRTGVTGFARILCTPLAGVYRHRFLMVLQHKNGLPPPPPPVEAEVPTKAGRKLAPAGPGRSEESKSGATQ
ncbi:rod shape-determining protein MreC [Piscinibacterium candidicorallinum]|uniref:Cell shape-determining protein MreC n=1 Tax=Piscinibacterium candidicorallinum TaxID=1793872 RepID=A0ABV7H514_9BURK